MAADLDVPYVIVGAGPVGLTAARLLANAGRRVLVVERREGPQRTPAAHVVNARTLEIFRQAGFDMAAIAEISGDPADSGHVNFVTKLNGDLIGRLPFEQQGDDCLAHTPTPLRNISQHRLEPLMSADVAARPGVDLRYRVEWVSAMQDDDGVTSVVRNLDTGEETTVRSSWLLGADGAGSAVRKSLGIEMIGPASLQSFVAIHMRADLRPYVAHRLGVLHFVMDPSMTGTFIAHDLDRESVFMVAFDPSSESVADYPPERCTAIVRAAIGDPDAAVEIVGAGTWHMTAQVAERVQSGRVFLIGDAAHRFPPTGGMGLNTGVGDAHNLVWKLIACDDGWAGASLPGTYGTERRPIAEVNCQQSATNAFKMVTLIEALGLRSGTTSEELAARLADPAHRERIDAAVLEQATHFDMLGLQLGYIYADGALVRDGDPPGPIVDPTPFEPHGEVGARLPHAWLADGRSTLDLIAPSGFTLLCTGGAAGVKEWTHQVELVRAQTNVPITVVAVDAPGLLEWRDQCGLGTDAALLVRPDQHIAWRADAPATADALGSVVATIGGR